MKTVGIIAEYDPFHHGHQYHLREALRLSGADRAVVVMSGPFMQRGTPAMTDKWKRAEMAVRNGVSLVIELPFLSACAGSMDFAAGAVRILNESGLADSLAFGCENPDPEMLDTISEGLLDRDGALGERIREFLSTGVSYPNALTRSVEMIYGTSSAEFLAKPNNLLATEYVKAMKQQHCRMTPIPIPRRGADHHDTELSGDSGSMLSGSGIRQRIDASGAASVFRLVPPETYRILEYDFEQGLLIPGWKETRDTRSFDLLKYRLATITPERLCQIDLVDEGLEHRILRFLPSCNHLDAFLLRIKTRRFTYARLTRMLTAILMDLSREEATRLKHTAYARILAFDRKGAELLRKHREQSRIPLISNLSHTEQLPVPVQESLKLDQRAADLYSLICGDGILDRDRFHVPFILK